ncbi:TDP-N-acetylfucosamine:lipid II N-acetylfucosaminyltransferase [Salinimicrobium xinjiangense]|uniref:TDP-N-acetylfucosamine:lipid II N-acetylfucosaminyltransferase n=1 Tax=Salinimicrobium xinjiangense TaxID=438596 RepID=UPI00048D5D42|nr:TDP-N-acetylfucosamine:lipid II N-acetylfucosaminyltransferase [Salinimicrobium xinjiangense]
MLNIHLCNDEKFINIARERFENHYPNCNIFIVNNPHKKSLKYVHPAHNIFTFDFNNKEVEKFIISETKGEKAVNLLVHFLDNYKLNLIIELKKKIKFRVFWIFYGADIYNFLHRTGRYQLYDKEVNIFQAKIKRLLRGFYFNILEFKKNRKLKTFIKNLDFFCFWNYYDYLLLKNNFDTKAEYRKFGYGSTHDFTSNFDGFKTRSKVIMVNNSGSTSGNHLTILRKLNDEQIKNSFSDLIVPLSYGSPQTIQEVNNFCLKNFKDKYEPLKLFMDQTLYFQKMKTVDVVFFGHLRQEGAGNITYLLALGSKIFLREQNNLLRYYRDLGLILFSWETDFNNEKDLEPLTLSEQKNNRDIIMKEFSPESFNKIYKNLFK